MAIHQAPTPPRRSTPHAPVGKRRTLLAGLGAFVGLGTLGALATSTGSAWLVGSFGASCVLLFGFPDVPFSRTRNVIGGHVLSSATGLLFLHLLGPHWWAMASAGACAAMLMMATDTVHPPAGSNPVIVFLSQPGWDFLVLPTLAGACTLVLLGRGYFWLAHASADAKSRLSARAASRPMNDAAGGGE